jgi:hypothetical protein
MILPFLLGVVISRMKREHGFSRNLVLYVGIISGLQIVPLAYPFYSIINPHLSAPNFIYTYFLIPDFVIWRVAVQNILISPTIVFIFIPVCIIGSLLGLYCGNHFFRKHEQEIWT